MIVAIDGPAGAGKSSAARALAERLGFRFLDTGAMYRLATLAVLRAGLDESRPEEVLKVVRDSEIDVTAAPRLNGEDVSAAIRSPELARKIFIVADNPAVRGVLSELQRRFGADCDRVGVVTEGRDQGTEVFPQAECKVFLTARPETRARRAAELAAAGVSIDLAQMSRDLAERDARDAARSVGALRQAPDAAPLWTDDLTFDQVVDRLVELVKAARPGA